MYSRRRVPPEELLRILNKRLRAADGCEEDVSFSKAPYQLAEAGEYGQNWDTEMILRFSGRGADSHCAEAANRIVAEVAQEFDVDWPTT